MINAAHKLAFPVFSRLQLQRDRLRNAYVRITRALSLVTLPGYVGLALVAYEAIVVVFGERWAPAAEPAALLFLSGPVLAVQLLSGSLLNAVGHPEVTLRIRLVTTIVNVTGFLVAVIVFASITAVAAAFLIRAYVLLPLILFWLRRYAGIPWSAHTWELRTPILATFVMALGVIGVKLALGGSVSLAALLLAEMLTGIAVYAVCVWLIDRSMVAEVVSFARAALPRGRANSRRPANSEDLDASADGPTMVDA
jgi:PST family polysaccharide transporter